jgi:serine/threonine protein kinase
VKDSDVQCAWQMASRVGLHDLDGTLAAERTRTRTMPSADVQQLAPINEDGSGASGSESNSSISSAGSDTSHGSPANVQAKNRPRSDETTRAVRTPSNALGPVAGRAASPFIASPFPGAKIRAWSQLESQQPLLSEMATEVVEAPPVGKAAGSGTLDQRFAHLLEGHRQQMDPDEVKKGYLAVVDKLYKKISVMGKGGGGKVYKVHAAEDESQVFAVKKIKLVPNDDDLRESVFNEIALLVALSGQPSIIKMYDYEIADEYVYMVMECGEQDLAQALAKKQVRSLRGVWRAMIESLQTVHDQRVVHGDLKPANFLMVNRELKLIDFGIARKIESDNTTNIMRESAVGTVNYMAPEAFQGTQDAAQRKADGGLKLGRASDIWSLGCILYQMVYGRPPFNKYQNQLEKMQAICNRCVPIDFPKTGLGGAPVETALLDVLKRCLDRDCSKRPTIPELRVHPWLVPPKFALDSYNVLVMVSKVRSLHAANPARTDEDIQAELIRLMETAVLPQTAPRDPRAALQIPKFPRDPNPCGAPTCRASRAGPRDEGTHCAKGLGYYRAGSPLRCAAPRACAAAAAACGCQDPRNTADFLGCCCRKAHWPRRTHHPQGRCFAASQSSRT